MFETLRDTWGFRTFMSDSSSATGRLRCLAALAAVFPEEVRQRAQGGEHRAVIDVRALATRLEEPRPHQAVDVVAQRRGRDVDLRLDLTGRGAFRPRLHDVTQDAEANGMPQGSELLGMQIQLLYRHTIILVYSNNRVNGRRTSARGRDASVGARVGRAAAVRRAAGVALDASRE